MGKSPIHIFLNTTMLRSLFLTILLVTSGCAVNQPKPDSEVTAASQEQVSSAAGSDSESVEDAAKEIAKEEQVEDGEDENENDDEYDEEFDDDEYSDRDPLESVNRFVYGFNTQLDRFILRPVAVQYVKLPSAVRNRVSSFFSNLGEPTTVANDLLQGKWYQAVEDSTRFFVNSTAGILGLFDVATHVDLPKNDEDFGQTLGRWGIGEGPYLMLPLLGPSNLRDGIGLIPEFLFTDPVSYIDSSATRLATRGVQITDTRTGLLRADKLLEMQLDPYIFLRESYRQKREGAILDGADPE